MMELIEQSQVAVDKLNNGVGRATIEAVLRLSAERIAGPPHPGKKAGLSAGTVGSKGRSAYRRQSTSDRSRKNQSALPPRGCSWVDRCMQDIILAAGKSWRAGNGGAVRRRFQSGSVRKRGKRPPVWEGRYYEPVLVAGKLKKVGHAVLGLRNSPHNRGESLFLTERGKIYNPRVVERLGFAPVIQELKLQPFTWRSFRRSGATALHVNNVPLKVQQGIMGMRIRTCRCSTPRRS